MMKSKNFLKFMPRKACGGAVIGILTVFFVLFAAFIYPRQSPIRILAYHSIRGGHGAGPAIPRRLFARQLDHLFRHGYEPVFLSRAIGEYTEAGIIPAHWIVLTFDAEDPTFYSVVYPLLRKYNFKATIFVRAAYVQSGCPAWAQLREMRDSGLVEVGSHSVGHPALTCLPLSEAAREITVSKTILEENLKSSVLAFAYPYGAVNTEIEKIVKRAGYVGAVGTVYRMGEFEKTDIYNLQRVYVSRISGVPLMFRFMVSGYYVPVRAWVLRLLHIKTPRFAQDCGVWARYKTGMPFDGF